MFRKIQRTMSKKEFWINVEVYLILQDFLKSCILDEATDYRSVVKWKYLIIYKIKNDQVWILNIIHTSRHPNLRSDV
jgi:plasmid stabilization system protein ParE